MKKILFFLIILSIFGLISCKEQSTKYYNGPQYGDPPFYTNVNNPYDYYGAIHNQTLDYYITHLNYTGTDLDSLIDDVADVCSDYLASINPDSIQSNIKEYYENILHESADTMDEQTILTRLNNKASCEDTYLKKKELLDNLSEYGSYLGDIGPAIDTIKAWEDGVIINLSWTASEKKELLAWSAVLRYSAYYWNIKINDPNSLWRQLNPNVNVDNWNVKRKKNDRITGIFDWIPDAWDWVCDHVFESACIVVADATGGGLVGGVIASAVTAYGVLK